MTAFEMKREPRGMVLRQRRLCSMGSYAEIRTAGVSAHAAAASAECRVGAYLGNEEAV